MTGQLRVMLVEPYFSGSHRAWAEGYSRHSRHAVALVTHEGQFWRWRMRGGALTLADEVALVVERSGRPDVLLVSDMVNLPALLGLTRGVLDDVPVALYLHENQLLYPQLDRRGRSSRGSDHEELSLVNWLSLATADLVLFNSAFHRDALLAALPELLARAPDRDHRAHLASVIERSAVLPVGVDLSDLLGRPRRSDPGAPPLVVWNQRWDHDKDPRRFFGLLFHLADEGVPFRLALAGENERIDPREFFRARARLADRVVHVGALPRPAYSRLLLRSDVTVSTARHEFFGVGAVEAMAAGAVPVLPRRLSYPELVPGWAHDAVLYEEGEALDRLRAVLTALVPARIRVSGLRAQMRRFSWPAVAPEYDDRLDRLVSGYRPHR